VKMFEVRVVTPPFRLFSTLLYTPAPSARFRVLTVGRGWHRRPRNRTVDPFEFRLVALPGIDSYTLVRRINYYVSFSLAWLSHCKVFRLV
jgi:hypothetical protein